MKITYSNVMCIAKRAILRGSHSTQFESFLIVSTKTGKKIFENHCQTSYHVGLEWRLSKMRESSVCLPLAYWQKTLVGISKAMNDNKSTTRQISAKWERRRPTEIKADGVKPRRGKTVFSRLHLDAIDFFLVKS